ncbi:MAG: DUF883 family protein [Telluria sp.]|jgi:ElaB/YqjD/DUF883 family membrane-anchored ribosome-binding protein
MFGSTASKIAPKSTLNGASSNAGSDVRALVKDAQTLLAAAAHLTGDKADEMRGKGMDLLNSAMGSAKDLQDQALAKGKELAQAGDDYVRDNPWKTAAVAAGIGVLLGMLLSRR